MKKRGVSPVVATVLLIAIVVILALIVFLWFRGFTQESITKFGGENIELVCEDIKFEAEYISSSQELAISNLVAVPIFTIKVKMIKEGGAYSTKDIRDIDSTSPNEGWPSVGLKQNQAFGGTVDLDANTQELLLVPVLMGTTGNGKQKAVVCDERFGYKITL